MNTATDRVVVLVDMDCFYVQVEQREKPELKGKPCAVVQYNQWKGGGIIAVGYEARAHGISRSMRGDEASKLCPDIVLCSVPAVRGKADLTKYRDAGAEVIRVLARFCNTVERASIDEAYLDITDQVERLDTPTPAQLSSTFLVGRSSDAVEEWLSDLVASSSAASRLARGATLVERIRKAVFDETGFRCSAGVSHNKVLAKFACGMHKPNRQTILPFEAVNDLYDTLSVKKIRNLGGKLGTSVIEDLGINTMGELRDRFTEAQLCDHYGDKTGRWLFLLARGVDLESVTGRQLAKSIGCSKSFPGKNALDSRTVVRHWIQQLAEEVVERLVRDREQNDRQARNLVLFLQHQAHPRPVSFTRTCALPRYDTKKLVDDAMVLLRPFNTAHHGGDVWSPAITYLGLSAGKFLQLDQKDGNIRQIFSSVAATSTSTPSPFIATSVNSSIKRVVEHSSASITRNAFECSSSKNETAILNDEDSACSSNKSSRTYTPAKRKSFFERLALRKSKCRIVEQVASGNTLQDVETCSVSSTSDSAVQDEGEILVHASKVSPQQTNQSLSFFERLAERNLTIENKKKKSRMEPKKQDVEKVSLNETTEFNPANEREDHEEEEQVTFSSQTDFMICDECGQRILMFDMPEHQDFHVAEKLHQELQEDLKKERDQHKLRPAAVPITHTRRKRGRPPGAARLSSRTKNSGNMALDKFFR